MGKNNMKKYKVTITETLEQEVEVEAESMEEALEVIEDRYCDSVYVLDYENYKETKFFAEELPSESEKSVKSRKDFSR